MMDLVKTLLPVAVPAGLGGLVVWVVARGLWTARQPQVMTCPEDGEAAEVEIDLRHAAVALFAGRRQRVIRCSRWTPDRSCARTCEVELLG